MNNGANLIHWIYVCGMPIGPIWFLHGFYTISAMIMMVWYCRFEKSRPEETPAQEGEI